MDRIEVSNVLIDRLLSSHAIQGCLNCECWDLKKDLCLKFNAKPPAQTIVYSCGKDWQFDVPF